MPLTDGSASKPGKPIKHPSPIAKLNHDILWHILALNADMEQETEEEIPALDTLRYTSQVCPEWRDLAIGSPSLWARVLNIRYLARGETQDWRMEVIRRTGTSPLHIKASGDALAKLECFVQWRLNEDWARIRSLDLEFSTDCRTVDDESWEIFQHPASFLESFKISWCGTTNHSLFISDPDFTLFANEAPSLHTLSVRNIALNLSAFRASNLRHLVVVNSPFATCGVLHALTLMPFEFLETLQASDATTLIARQNIIIDISLPPVGLPRLKKIELHPAQEIDNILSLLVRIIPADGCVLHFHGSYGPRDFPDSHSVTAAHKVLSTYSRYCTELTTATKCEVTLSGDFVEFLFPLPSGGSFFFVLDSEIDFPEQAISTLIASFPITQFNKITALALTLPPVEPLDLDPAISKFIHSLIAVEELETDPITLQHVGTVQSSTEIVALPILKTIRLDQAAISDREEISFLESFLQSRIATGTSMDALTVTVGSDLAVDLAFVLLDVISKKFIGLTLLFLADDEDGMELE